MRAASPTAGDLRGKAGSASQSEPGEAEELAFPGFLRYKRFLSEAGKLTGKPLPASPTLPQTRLPEGRRSVKITAKTVAAAGLPAGKTDAIYFDDALPGFGLRVRMSGGRIHRSYVVQYKRAGVSRRYLIGSSDVLNTEQARAAAKEALGKVALGQDVQRDRVAARNRPPEHSLRAVVDDHVAAKRKTVQPNTMRDIVRYLTGPYFAPLHKMPINQVTRRDVAARLTRIANEHSPVVAAAARNKLTSFFSWAMAHGLVEQNPCIGTLKPKGNAPRERVLDDAEIAAIWKAADEAGAFGKVLKLLLLTGCRRQEIGGMAWSELDLERGNWTLPAHRAKNGRAHTLPLPPMAVEIITSVPRLVGRDLLFGEYGARGFSTWDFQKQRLDARLGDAVKPWTVHDTRRTVATKVADIGVQPHIIETILNHVSGHKAGPAGIYNRSSYEREVKTAMLRWADHIAALVEGRASNVISIA
jgi:integrase